MEENQNTQEEQDAAALQSFIAALASLGHQLADIFRNGKMNISTLERMNATIEEMSAIEKANQQIDEIVAVSEDTRAIYYNFNAIVGMIQSQESRFMDNTTMKAVNLFLKNINESVIKIASSYGLV